MYYVYNNGKYAKYNLILPIVKISINLVILGYLVENNI